MPFVDADLRPRLNLDDSPNSIQRLEMALHSRFTAFDEISDEDRASLVAYLGPIYQRYAGGKPVPGSPALLRCGDGQTIDLHALMGEVFEKMNGLVLFKACYVRLDCLPANPS